MRHLLYVFTLFSFLGCGDVPSSVNDFPLTPHLLKSYEPPVEPQPLITLVKLKNQKEYEELCYQTQYWYCPPLSAVWRKVVVIDVCNDEGTPCDPETPECEWEIISIGKCEEIFECDPMGDFLLGEVECEIDGRLGRQNYYCDKGFFDYGPCIPCEEEKCDGVDNDCDGLVDEGEYPCATECGEGKGACIEGKVSLCDAPQPEEEVCNWEDDDCDGEIDEGQRNACNSCGDVPEEHCDGIDNDCDGKVDEDLYTLCSTECGDGYQQCVSGIWLTCSAQQPQDEFCNGLDDDCDGLIDEELSCECPLESVGTLFPCSESPLVCGQGFKSCVCVDDACTETAMTDCFALCYFIPLPGVPCEEDLGAPAPEMCNDHDDDCDEYIDEDLFASCYSGPEETLNVGTCKPGEMVCDHGMWGSFIENTFIEGICSGEVLPLDEDLCSDADNNCDGNIDKIIEPTDILFIIDGSGSMYEEIEAVISAVTTFATNYSDSDKLKWALVVGPWKGNSLHLLHDFTTFQYFIPTLQSLQEAFLAGGMEMLYDAIYITVASLISPSSLAIPLTSLQWASGVPDSVPSLLSFKVSWRKDAHHVIIVFSDEEGQSFLSPQLSQSDVITIAKTPPDLSIYAFSSPYHKNSSNWKGDTGWEPICIGGSWFELTTSPVEMFDNLMEILDETACGGTP